MPVLDITAYCGVHNMFSSIEAVEPVLFGHSALLANVAPGWLPHLSHQNVE